MSDGAIRGSAHRRRVFVAEWIHPLSSPCIPTSVGSVRFASDGSVVAQGFTVDAVVPC